MLRIEIIGTLGAIVIGLAMPCSATQPVLETVPVSIGRMLETPPIHRQVHFVDLWDDVDLWEQVPLSEGVAVPRIDFVPLEPVQTFTEGPVETPSPPESWSIVQGITPSANQPIIGFELHRDATSWLVGNGNDFGFFSLEGVSTLQIGRVEGVFGGYAAHFVGGPVQTDMPPRLIELFLGYRVIGDLNWRWGYDVTVSTGIYSDSGTNTSKAWRTRGVALVKYRHTPITSLVLGVAYLDRENLKLLPVGGLVIELSEHTALELMFPEPRLTTLFRQGKSWESELYVRGQIGGGSWSIRRPAQPVDVVTYEDFRVFVGISSDDDDGENSFYEVGYVFNRTLEYRSGIGDMPLRDSIMFRYGVRY